jgi:uncharacterized protein
MKQKALIFHGGWQGHEPKLVSQRFKHMLEKEGELNGENLEFFKKTFPSPDGAFQTDYVVNIKRGAASPITEGIPDFKLHSEQYYLHVDPCINVLATTQVNTSGPHSANGPVTMPVVYTKLWGKGRIFYSSLGHVDNVFEIPEVTEITRRGLLWAAKKR